MNPLPPAARRQRWAALLLGSGEKRRRNTAMTALGAAMMLCCTLVVRLLAAEGNGMDMQQVHWWATLAPLGLLGTLVLVRSGWSERFSDPSLAQFQLFWALGFNAMAYAITGPARALALPLLVITMMFGIFSRTRREVLALMVYAIAAYALAMVFAAYRSPSPMSPAMLTAQLVIVLASIVTCTLMCLRVQNIRRHLRRQKDDLRAALQQIQQMAMRDHLTGLVNRRQMSELMALELHRCQRSSSPPLLAQLDIDHFKAINDTYGHAVGDQALQAFADTAVAHLRSSDVLARWGGEEFVLLLCDTPPAAAADLLERVRCAVAAHALQHGSGPVHMTVSIGWTEHQRGEPLEATLQRADQALYDAKHGGRNRVVQAPSAAAAAATATATATATSTAPPPAVQPPTACLAATPD
ncbi:MAG: GGDEF domain-containing protein [Giesbergeria sp.]|nr:GGDEF domain-containing protein [Giesbergeria sp.]MBP8092038.1 GGDEF domain-containing protein [Giesbergeria sp.]